MCYGQFGSFLFAYLRTYDCIVYCTTIRIGRIFDQFLIFVTNYLYIITYIDFVRHFATVHVMENTHTNELIAVDIRQKQMPFNS